MIIVRSLFDRIEELFELARLPAVERLRPSSCPLCGQLAFSPGERLGIVGHGTYRRQVLGVVEVEGEPFILVRRYLCRGCRRTISILSDDLHPHRWYAAGVIVEALRLHLLEDRSEREIREHFGVAVDSGSWRSLRRWRSQFLVTLWYWLARRLGYQKKPQRRSDAKRRLQRLLSQADVELTSGGCAVARALLGSSVHFRGHAWALGRDPPEKLKAELAL